MKKVKLNVEMLAWQYRAGHEEAMRKAMDAHGIVMEVAYIGDVSGEDTPIPRVILTSCEGIEHSVFDTNYVILADWGVEVIPEDDYMRDYTRVG